MLEGPGSKVCMAGLFLGHSVQILVVLYLDILLHTYNCYQPVTETPKLVRVSANRDKNLRE